MPQSQRSPSSTASRREFLKTSAVGMAAASGLPLARSAHAAGSEAIKIGMLGCGGRCSGAAAQALSLGKDVKLAGMNDVFEKRMRGRKEYFKTRFPDQFIATDETCTYGLEGYKKVIEASDAVLIACASKYHPFYAEEAVKAGKHVFVEKPHAIDPAGCRQLKRLCELAKQKNVSVVSGHESRYSPAYAEMVQRIHDGAIGNIVSIQSLVHNLDRMRWALREENPTWCFGLAGRSTSFGEVYGDMFDHHTAVYEFTSGVRLYALCQTRANCHSVWDDIIMGSKGVCYWADCRIEGETKWRYEGPHAPPSGIEEQQILIGAIRDGRVVNHGDTMIDSTYVAVMGQLACYCGKPVTWDQMMAADFEFEPKLADVRLDMDAPVKPDASGNYPLPVPGVTKYF